MSLTSLAKQKMLRMDTFASFPFLVEITHNNSIYRFVNSDSDKTFEGNVYTATVFAITPPSKDTDRISDGKVVFSNIDSFWTNLVRISDEIPKLRFVAVIEYENGNSVGIEAIEDLSFNLTKPSWDEVQISFTMEYEYKRDIRVPAHLCDSITTPGVV